MAKRTNLERRVIMRIELLPQAKERLIGYGDSMGMTQVAVTTRLVEWFSGQEDTIQAGVLGLYPEDIRDQIPAMILKRLASEKRSNS